MRCTDGIASRAIFGVAIIASLLGTSPASGQVLLYHGVATGVRFSCGSVEADSPARASHFAGAGGMNLGFAAPVPADHAYGYDGTSAPPAPDGSQAIAAVWGASVSLGGNRFAVVDPSRSALGGTVVQGAGGLLVLHGGGPMEHYGPGGIEAACSVDWTFQGQSRGIPPNPPIFPPNPPTGPWGLCIQGVEIKARAPAAGGRAPQWVATTPCARGTTCFAVPGSSRADLLVRMLPLGNGRVGPAYLALSASSFDVWTRPCGANQQTHSWMIPAATNSPARGGLLDLVGHRAAPASPALDEAAAPDADVNLELDGGFEPAAAPPPPSSPWLSTPALPGFRFKAQLAGTPLVKATSCAKEAICLAKKAGNAPDVVVRILKKQSNGKRWSSLGKFAQPAATVWIEQVSTHVVKYYALAARPADSPLLPGVLDRTAFAP